MVDTAWEKPVNSAERGTERDAALAGLKRRNTTRIQSMIGGVLILGAIFYLVASGTLLGQQYFITVDNLLGSADYAGQSVRLTGAVIGDTIQMYEDAEGNSIIEFTVAHVPIDTGNLADALNYAANNPDEVNTLAVYVKNRPKPELLQHEAQAILEGRLGEDGVFYASNVQFKCPSRFGDDQPRLPGQEDHPGMQRAEA